MKTELTLLADVWERHRNHRYPYLEDPRTLRNITPHENVLRQMVTSLASWSTEELKDFHRTFGNRPPKCYLLSCTKAQDKVIELLGGWEISPNVYLVDNDKVEEFLDA